MIPSTEGILVVDKFVSNSLNSQGVSVFVRALLLSNACNMQINTEAIEMFYY